MAKEHISEHVFGIDEKPKQSMTIPIGMNLGQNEAHVGFVELTVQTAELVRQHAIQMSALPMIGFTLDSDGMIGCVLAWKPATRRMNKMAKKKEEIFVSHTTTNTVRLMLGCKEIPEALLKRLCRVEKLVRNTGGILQSRQVIATIVAQWQNEEECA